MVDSPPPDPDARLRQDLTHLKVYAVDSEDTMEVSRFRGYRCTGCVEGGVDYFLLMTLWRGRITWPDHMVYTACFRSALYSNTLAPYLSSKCMECKFS